MDKNPSVWEHLGTHIGVFRAGVVGLAAIVLFLAFFAISAVPTLVLRALVVSGVMAAVWAGLVLLIGRVEQARRQRLSSLQKVRDFAQRLVIYDRETGLYADWYFRLRLQEELSRSRRFGHPCALLLVESAQGRLGREGEEQLFNVMTQSFRGTDLVAHLGSLRFAVLLTNTPTEGARIARSRLLDRAPPGMLHAGLACFPDDGEDWQALMTAAARDAEMKLSPSDELDSVEMGPLTLKGRRGVA